MKHSTFLLLRNAHLGAIDRISLHQAEQEESDPFIKRVISLVLENENIAFPWDVKRFTTEFIQTNPKSKLTETIFAFILRIIAIIKEESYIRSLRKPESCCSALMAWIVLLKNCIFCITTLLYNVRWTSQQWMALDKTILMLINEGNASHLRKFFHNDLHLEFLNNCPITEAEHSFHKLNFLTVTQFGSFFWRLLHWMAEAVDYHKDSENSDVQFAINMWRQIILINLYRMLRCGICMNHLQQLTKELESQLLNKTIPYGKLWFNIHNKVNAARYFPFQQQQQLPYSEEDYAKDSEFMRKVFDN